jgi:hypothetical protein
MAGFDEKYKKFYELSKNEILENISVDNVLKKIKEIEVMKNILLDNDQ